MNPRFLKFYNQELQHIRELGAEFAHEYPKIASRLGLEGFECADPYVERLLEGFAFMAARVQLKLDSRYPDFTQHILELVYPNYLAPTPSMAVVQLKPNMAEGSLQEGYKVPRDTPLKGFLQTNQTRCEYRTSQDVTLWPISISEAEYLPTAGEAVAKGVPHIDGMKAAMRVKLQTSSDLTFDDIPMDSLDLYFRGSENIPIKLYEQFIGNCNALVIQSVKPTKRTLHIANKMSVIPVGFDEHEALLPRGFRSFQGYRLLQEYFAFPDRFLFARLQDLLSGIQLCKQTEVEIYVIFNRSDKSLEHAISPINFGLFCAPAINLFPKRADRIHLNNRSNEFHLVPDRTRPMDFEVYQVNRIIGYGTSLENETEFHSFYKRKNSSVENKNAFYTIRREPRSMSSKQHRNGARSSYMGSEVFLSLVDADQAPYDSNLRQLSVETLCTNRDLPLHMFVGRGENDFSLSNNNATSENDVMTEDFEIESGAPVEAVVCVAGPTKPLVSKAEGDTAWHLISHLSLNYLSLLQSNESDGANALREMLSLYSPIGESYIDKQIEGVRLVTSKPAIRRLQSNGPITVGRGLEITVTCDELAFEGTGAFLLGAVLDNFFAKYVSLNSFTETVIRTDQRGEIMRWPLRTGQRQIL